MKEKININLHNILTLIVILGLFLCFYNNKILSDNYIYAVEQIHEYDSSIFENNPSTSDETVSPRRATNKLTAFAMKAFQLNWEQVCVAVILFTYILYGIAVFNLIIRLFKKSRLLFGLIMTLAISKSTVGTLAGFSLFAADDIFLGTGIAFSILGFSFIFGHKKEWNKAWMCMAIAILMHIHEGLWGGFILFILQAIQILTQKEVKWKDAVCFVFYILILVWTVVPSLLTYDTFEVESFVNIYAFLRAPHHLLPSAWGWNNILVSFILISLPCLLFLFLQKNGLVNKCSRGIYKVIFSFLGIWLLILISDYLLIELLQNSAVTTMYPGKCFKYVSLLSIILYLWLIYKIKERRDLTSIAGIFVMAALLSGGTSVGLTVTSIMIALTIMIFAQNKDYFISTRTINLLYYLFLIPFSVNILNVGKQVICIIIISGILDFILLKNIKIKRGLQFLVVIGVFTVIISIAGYGTVYTYVEEVHIISAEEKIKNSAGEDLVLLAKKFKEKTNNEEVFLADPKSDAAGWFQLISKRNCYQVWKILPSSKKAVINWYDRFTEVQDVAIVDSKKIQSIMEKTRCRYILIPKERFTIFNLNKKIKVFLSTDSYRIYKMYF